VSDLDHRLAPRVRRYQHGSRVPGWDEAADLSKPPAVVPDPATTPVGDELRAIVEDFMVRYPDSRSAAIPAMRAAQARHGWLSPEAIRQVACVMRLTPAYLVAVATFYDMFELEPVGRHTIYVCTNISCSLRGADERYAEFEAEAERDGEVYVRPFECLGACDIAPMASVDGEYVGPLEEGDAAQIFADLREGREVLPAKQLKRRPAAEKLPMPDPQDAR
jgi:NADH:ubiquinone oxidoreductase subunit E